MAKAKPFIKWVGGKSQLIEQLEALLPADFEKRENVTYIEPFVGGGAMLFYMLQKYSNISKAIINDINEDLVSCYEVVRDFPAELIALLSDLQKDYYSLADEAARKDMFLQKRDAYNGNVSGKVERAVLLIFLNKTCFNGLYRVNRAGKFNVPFGKYVSPMICDKATIYADSKLLQNVDIVCGDFEETLKKACGDTFFYFDPPYRPISDTSCFNDYAKVPFNDLAQLRLKTFCDKVRQSGYSFMLSNSDCDFFDVLYSDYSINHVFASRSVNAVASKRGKVSEIVVRNYGDTVSYGEMKMLDLKPNIVAEDECAYGTRF